MLRPPDHTHFRAPFARRFPASEKGAYLVELALVLPILLAMVAFCLFIILTVDQLTALATSVSRAGSAAVSRSDPGKIRNWDVGLAGAIPALDAVGAIQSLTESSPLYPLFYRGVVTSDAEDFYRYDGIISGDVYGADVGSLEPPIFRYMLAYTHAEMAALLGNRVRFPCDPDDPEYGAGCLLCVFRNPRVIPQQSRILGPEPTSQDLPICDNSFQGREYYCDGTGSYDYDEQTIGTHIHMQCRYAPSGIIMRLLSGAFGAAGIGGVSSNQAVIQRDKIIDMRNEQWIGIMGEG